MTTSFTCRFGRMKGDADCIFIDQDPVFAFFCRSKLRPVNPWRSGPSGLKIADSEASDRLPRGIPCHRMFKKDHNLQQT